MKPLCELFCKFSLIPPPFPCRNLFVSFFLLSNPSTKTYEKREMLFSPNIFYINTFLKSQIFVTPILFWRKMKSKILPTFLFFKFWLSTIYARKEREFWFLFTKFPLLIPTCSFLYFTRPSIFLCTVLFI